MISYAQNAEDVVLARALAAPEGFYVDVGAADPDVASVTKFFYEKGWRGINIDARNDAVRRLQEARPRDINLNVAVGAMAGIAELFVVDGDPDLSTTDPTDRELLLSRGYTGVVHKIPIRTLDDILEECGAGPIDFVKIDVEGAELDVLAGFDIARWQPDVIVVEAVRPYSHDRSDPEWRDILETAGYREASFDGLNLFFARDPAIAALLVPASPVDDFEPIWVRELRAEVDRLRVYVGKLETTVHDLGAEHERTAEYAKSLEQKLEDRQEEDRPPPSALRSSRQLRPHTRLAVIGTPRSGNTWVRRVLADTLGATEVPVHHPADIEWNRLPDEFVIQLHWPRTNLLESTLVREGVVAVSPARHPLDTLLSMVEFARREPNVHEWLGGSVVDRSQMCAAKPGDGTFTSWAVSDAASKLLAVTEDWWNVPSTARVRYEELVDDPRGGFEQLLLQLGVHRPESLEAAVRANTRAVIHALSGNVHVWRGRPGAWQELLAPAEATEVAAAYKDLFFSLGYQMPHDSLPDGLGEEPQ